MSIGYVLDAAQWTTFALPPETQLLKILTNANFPASFEPDPEKRWWYELQYQVTDKDNRLLLEHAHHLHTRITHYTDPATGENVFPRFYLNRDVTPASSKPLFINLSKLENAAFIRFRLAWKDPSIVDVLLRSYVEEKIAERKIGYLWHRMSEEGKRTLAIGNVYPVALLTDQEKYHLLQKMWRPMGPIGLQDRDYRPRNLYVLQEGESERVIDSRILPQGLFIDSRHRGIIPIPENGGKIVLEFTGVAESPASEDEHIHIRWFGTNASDRSEDSMTWSGQATRFENTSNGGLLEIETTSDVVIRAFLDKEPQREEITPEPSLIRTYLTRQDMPLTFQVSHIRDSVTPFRVDCRSIMAEESSSNRISAEPPLVRYQLLNAEDTIVSEGNISLVETVSLYDSISRDRSGIILSDAQRRFFALPADIDRIRFISERPVLITAYSRPSTLIKETRVPDDYHEYRSEETPRQPTWFSLQPEERQHLLQENRSLMLTVQQRPPEDKPGIKEGQYRWEAFHPEASWQGRYLFTSRDAGEPVREELFEVLYHRVEVGKESTLYFRQPAKGLNTLQPTLFFTRPGDEHAALDIMVDGRAYHSMNISGTRGDVELPPLSPGEHRVKILAPEDTTCYINYLRSEEAPLLKRFANRLNQDGLEFLYEKTEPEEEILLFHLFVPANQADSSLVRVDVDAERRHDLQPLPAWTLLHRRYLIQPDQGKPVPVLNTRDEFVDQGRLFFLPLGGDLSPGRYSIRVRLEQDQEGYLIFSKITLGRFEKRNFFRERGIVTDDMVD